MTKMPKAEVLMCLILGVFLFIAMHISYIFYSKYVVIEEKYKDLVDAHISIETENTTLRSSVIEYSVFFNKRKVVEREVLYKLIALDSWLALGYTSAYYHKIKAIVREMLLTGIGSWPINDTALSYRTQDGAYFFTQ